MTRSIRHIGIGRAFCDGRKRAYLRTDLGAARYRELGISERFIGEEPYKICRACIKRVDDWKWRMKNRRTV